MLSSFLNQAGIMSKLHASGQQKTLLRPQELDIYYEPIPTESAGPEKPYPEVIYDQVRAGRQRLTGVFSGLLTTHERVSETFANTEGKIYSTYTRTLEDPYFLLKPGAIIIATAGGALVAGKGRKPIQRTLYSLLFGITASAVCYPERAVDIATTGYYHTQSSISQLFSSFGHTTTDRVVEELKEEEAVVGGDAKSDVISEPKGDTDTSPQEGKTEAPKSDEGVDTTQPATDVFEEAKESIEEEYVVVDSTATSTEEPITSTEEPVAPTEEPVAAKEEPVAPTEEPVAPTEEPVAPMEEPIVSTEEPAPAEVEVSITKAPLEPTPEPYNPQQTELKEILESPFSNTSDDNSKDVTREMEFETTKNIGAVVEGDPGQSNPEDADMYSTRS